MFPYVVVARPLTHEEADEKNRRWRLFFWLLFVGFFVLVVNSVFDAYKEVVLPQWFRYLIYLTVPSFLSWWLVRYWRVVCAVLLAYYVLVGLLNMGAWL